MVWLKYLIIRDDINHIADKFKSNTTNTINIGKLFI